MIEVKIAQQNKFHLMAFPSPAIEALKAYTTPCLLRWRSRAVGAFAARLSCATLSTFQVRGASVGMARENVESV